jgi:hypothetical protein
MTLRSNARNERAPKAVGWSGLLGGSPGFLFSKQPGHIFRPKFELNEWQPFEFRQSGRGLLTHRDQQAI